MWPFHLMHTTLAIAALVHGSHKFHSFSELIDTATHWELAGAIMLTTSVFVGAAALVQEAATWIKKEVKRAGRRRPQKRKAVKRETGLRQDDARLVRYRSGWY